MIYRFLTWLKSFFYPLVKCQLCSAKEEYEKTATIKVRCSNNAIIDMIICSSCADKLEQSKGKH